MSRPSTYVNWCPDGSPAKIQQPSGTLATTGYVASQSPTFKNFNYLVYQLDQWVQYLDGIAAVTSAASSVFDNIRLLDGGFWSFVEATGVLAWSAGFELAIPGMPDSNNSVVAGNVALADGQIAYVDANVPISTTGNTVSGSPTVTSIANTQGITTGQTVTGTGIPASTTVLSIVGTTVTLSNNATATGTGVVLTFFTTTALTVHIATNSTFVPAANTVIFARCNGTDLMLGVNTTQMVLRDGESKRLLHGGYITSFTGTAGQALTAGQACYIAPSGDTGRTAGQIYPCDAGATNGGTRGLFAGIVTTSVSGGASARLITSGIFILSGLSPGAEYYVDPATPGALTATKPTTTNQYLVPVGYALDSTRLQINGATAATSQLISPSNSWPNLSAGSESALSTAIAAASAAGGGVIVLTGPFAVTGQYTVPSGTVLLGRKGLSILTMALNAAIDTTDNAEMQEVWFLSAQATGTLTTLRGNYANARQCRWSVPATSTMTCVKVATGQSMNRLDKCQFNGVLDTSAIGIDYSTAGIDNFDDSSLFTG